MCILLKDFVRYWFLKTKSLKGISLQQIEKHSWIPPIAMNKKTMQKPTKYRSITGTWGQNSSNRFKSGFADILFNKGKQNIFPDIFPAGVQGDYYLFPIDSM